MSKDNIDIEVFDDNSDIEDTKVVPAKVVEDGEVTVQDVTETVIEETEDEGAAESAEAAQAEKASDETEVEKEETVAEEVAEAAEPVIDKEAVKNEFIEEFAPDPILIPKYDREKEQIKHEKTKAKVKSKKSKKRRKRRRLVRKIVNIARNVFLFVLLLAILTTSVITVLVKVNTSEYGLKSAIRNGSPERFMIGEIKHPEKIMLKESSKYASVADILKDNAIIPVAYEDIEYAVRRSSMPDHLAKISKRVVDYYLYGKEFKEITLTDISEIIYENSSQIELVTGQKLGESACVNFARYIMQSPAIKELSAASLSSQKAATMTPATSLLFSLPMLIAMIILVIALLVLVIILCKGIAHKLIGWAIMASGVISGVLGSFYKLTFTPSSPFVKSVTDVLVKNFNSSARVFGTVIFVIGLLVILICSAMADSYDDDSEDDDFIEELESVTETK